MKYVITGGAGHVSKPIVENLLAAGHQVTVIGRKLENLKSLVDQGARPAVGSLEDPEFLTETFRGADAVYTMVPPNFAAVNWKEWIAATGKGYAKAIQAAGIRYVVNLSSVGADQANGMGPVSGLHQVEQALNALEGVQVKHLRAAYFFENLLANVGMVKQMNIIGSNFGGEEFMMVLVDPEDIAAAATEELLSLSFTGSSVRYVASDERNINELARVLGSSVGKPALPWVQFTDEQAYEGMVQAGLSGEIAKNYAEMGHAVGSGAMYSDYRKNQPAEFGKVKLEDFVKKFAAVYNAG